ncbi:autotransporter outer membrane beta-barrel domain-containing protein [Pseudomonas sp. LB3P25]
MQCAASCRKCPTPAKARTSRPRTSRFDDCCAVEREQAPSPRALCRRTFTLDSRLPGSRAEVGGGVMVNAAHRHHFFVEAGYTKGSDIEQPWVVTAGYRYSW